jgi:hypothetical protein
MGRGRGSLTPPRPKKRPALNPMAPSHHFPSTCRAQEDPVLLLRCVHRSVRQILEAQREKPLQRSWADHPYGEEEITRLEQEVLPALEAFLTRVDEIEEGIQPSCQVVAMRIMQGQLRLTIR